MTAQRIAANVVAFRSRHQRRVAALTRAIADLIERDPRAADVIDRAIALAEKE